MSPPVRLTLLAVLGAVLVVVALAQRSARAPSPPTKVAAFPGAVRATAPKLPQYADGPQTRVRQQLASVDAMWAAAFAAAGDRYERPRLVAHGERGCGAGSSAWAGLYCPPTRSIVIDLDGHARRHAVVGGGLSDLVLGYVVAHEAGHHVQTLRGAPEPRSLDGALRRELHADCLAGVWGKAAGLQLPPTWAYGEDPEHGTAAQRIRWLNDGYRRAARADCDTIWSGSTSP